MATPTRAPIVIPAKGGRHVVVLGNQIEVKLDTSATAGLAFVFEAVTPPGVGVPPHIHQHEDEIIRIIEGEFEIFLDGRRYQATDGAVINFPRSVVHAFRNSGTRPARALFVVTPGENFEKFFGELGALPSDAPPDMAKIAAIFERYGLPIVAGTSGAAAR